MAAKIIKGGGEGSAPVNARVAPVIRGADKKIDREVFSARNKADEIINEAQARVADRLARGRAEAEEAEQRAREEASHEAMLEAVTAILWAYRRRGVALMGAAGDCLAVAGTLVGKILGRAMTLPENAGLEVVEKGLRARRGRFAAVLKLPVEDVEAIKAHAPLWSGLQQHPELRVEMADEGSLVVATGEVPLTGAVAMQALCTVLEVSLPEGMGEPAAEDAPAEEGPTDESAAEPDGEQAAAAEEQAEEEAPAE
ncbi:MAG: hypothetical protein AB2A00_16935, partial [Myxococcota bacterium]